MRKLKKILLINWLYFTNQLLEVDNVNFITGKNGAGKSTVIDALQIVILGETNARNFNKAANGNSTRTLEGYLKADMDENNPFSRHGKDFSSYIACEFFDDMEGKSFVTGIVFDCNNDGSHTHRYFIYSGAIPGNRFIENREAMDITHLRTFLKANYGSRAKLYDSNKEYRTDMLAKWNVHNEQVIRMLKKAVSFQPIVNIQKFITENICDIPEKPDIEAMQQNIRDYKRHEQIAVRQEAKLQALVEIERLYVEVQRAADNYEQQDYLVHKANVDVSKNAISGLEKEKATCEKALADINGELQGNNELIVEKEQQRDEINVLIHQNDVAIQEEKLRHQKAGLMDEQTQLMNLLQRDAVEIKREALFLQKLCSDVQKFTADDLWSNIAITAARLTEQLQLFAKCDYHIFAQAQVVFTDLQETVLGLDRMITELDYALKAKLTMLQNDGREKEQALQNLHKNIKLYPKGLLSLKERLIAELADRIHKRVQIDILADVLEIKSSEEVWRRAVEGYLNKQKFYLLIEPEYFKDALRIYNKIKRDYSEASFGLVDIGKLREREKIASCTNSLAEKIETENALARVYIDYLLGRVICCEHVEDLRRYKVAITSEGMLYQGYVARPLRKALMDGAYIGQRAIALQMQRLEQELAQITEQLKDLELQVETSGRYTKHDGLFVSARYWQNTIGQRQEDYLRGLEIAQQLENVEEELGKLDLFWLTEQRQHVLNLEKEIRTLHEKNIALSKQVGNLEGKRRNLTEIELPEAYVQCNAYEYAILEKFTAEYIAQIGEPRYAQELKRLHDAAEILKHFSSSIIGSQTRLETSKHRLLKARTEYAEAFKPCSFNIAAENNDEYAQEQKLLEENELPRYREKIKKARESALEQFQNDFLAKLKSSIDQVQSQVRNLNKALKQAQFGTDKYQFHVDRNPDYADYYDMIMSPELLEDEVGLFALPFQQKYGKLIEDLFGQLAMSDDVELNAKKQSELQQNIERFTDFRTYLKFDLETTDVNGARQFLSKTLNTKSGGETQTPFYIAVLASFAQFYQVNNTSALANNTVRLVVFDEAFNKMDSERIVESIRLLRKMGLQAIICTPPDKLADIMPLADRTLLVSKDKYQMHILPYGKEIMGIEGA